MTNKEPLLASIKDLFDEVLYNCNPMKNKEPHIQLNNKSETMHLHMKSNVLLNDLFNCKPNAMYAMLYQTVRRPGSYRLTLHQQK